MPPREFWQVVTGLVVVVLVVMALIVLGGVVFPSAGGSDRRAVSCAGHGGLRGPVYTEDPDGHRVLAAVACRDGLVIRWPS